MKRFALIAAVVSVSGITSSVAEAQIGAFVNGRNLLEDQNRVNVRPRDLKPNTNFFPGNFRPNNNAGANNGAANNNNGNNNNANNGGNAAPRRNGADDAARIINGVSGLIGAMNANRNGGWNNNSPNRNGGQFVPPSRVVVVPAPGQVANPNRRIGRTVPRNALPVVTKQITVLNPEANGADVTFLADEEVVALKSGYFSKMETRSKLTIEFDRGGEFGSARYTLTEGTYRFDVTERGWELFKVKDEPNVAAN